MVFWDEFSLGVCTMGGLCCTPMSLQSQAVRSADLFAKCFGREPRWIVAAPGRVNLIGEHTDYNDGFVLPMAIDRYTVMAADRAPSREVTVHSDTTGETATFSLRSPIGRGDPAWSNYIRGVIAGFEGLGHRVPGFDAVIFSEVPYGGGLGSSAALEVATATLLEAILNKPLDPIEKALLCQKAEHEFAQVPCGIMDQFTSVLAREKHALLLDCRSRVATPVPMTDSGVTVMTINTDIRHRLAQTEYSVRRAQCETAARALQVPSLRDATMESLAAAASKLDPVVFRRARHVITENERTLRMARAIQSADWKTAGELMYASHNSLRDDYEVSCDRLDVIVESAIALGVQEGIIGCRMTGAGFGGCAVCLVRADAVTQVVRKIAAMYENRTRLHATIFSTPPAGGARVLQTVQHKT